MVMAELPEWAGPALIGGGGALLIWALGRNKGTTHGQLPPLTPLGPGEAMGLPTSPSLPAGAGPIALVLGQPLVILRPTVLYQGPGRDTYAYLRVLQVQNGRAVTVMGSGVAGVHVGPAPYPAVLNYPLVSDSQPQPGNYPVAALVAFVGGTGPTPICGGAPPVLGPATILLEVYQRKEPQDADGFSSPTCGSAAVPIPRNPVMRATFPNALQFVTAVGVQSAQGSQQGGSVLSLPAGTPIQRY